MVQQIVFDCHEPIHWLEIQQQCSTQWAQETLEALIHCLFESVKTDHVCSIHGLPLYNPFTHNFFIEYLSDTTQTILSDDHTPQQQYRIFYTLYQLLPQHLLRYLVDYYNNEQIAFFHWRHYDLYLCIQ